MQGGIMNNSKFLVSLGLSLLLSALVVTLYKDPPPKTTAATDEEPVDKPDAFAVQDFRESVRTNEEPPQSEVTPREVFKAINKLRPNEKVAGRCVCIDEDRDGLVSISKSCWHPSYGRDAITENCWPRLNEYDDEAKWPYDCDDNDPTVLLDCKSP
jgi:hypothetical protein